MIRNYEKLRQFGGQGIAISADSVHSHKVWAETSSAITTALKETGNKFPPMPMLANPTFEIGRKYGVVDEGQGVETRGRFIVDLYGGSRRLRGAECHCRRKSGRDIQAITSFQICQEHRQGYARGWKPGEEDIEPTIENGGRI